MSSTVSLTELERSITTDSPYSNKHLMKLRESTTTHHRLIPPPSTTSQPGLQLRRKLSLDSRTTTELEPQPSLMSPTLLTLSTGSLQALSPQLRTRDNADHAGLSLPLVLWKVLTSWPPRTSFHFPSSNWSIAQPRTLDAMVDSWTMLSNMPSQTK